MNDFSRKTHRASAWLERFEAPVLLRKGECFHRYTALDRVSGEPRLVVVGAPDVPLSEVRTRLDESMRVLLQLNHPRIPTVEARGRIGDVEFLSLGCDVVDDFATLLQHIAASGTKLPLTATSALADRFIEVVRLAHDTVDPNTGGPICLGGVSWSNILLSSNGEPWFLGWGDDLLVGKPDYSGRLILAPECMLGARPSPGGDCWALLTLFRGLFALRKLPESLDRILKGHPRESDLALARMVESIHAKVLAPPERRLADGAVMHQAYREIWSAVGVEPSAESFAQEVFRARRKRSSSPKQLSATDGRAGRYQIERELGSGASGVVYRAHDLQLGVDVALKRLRTDAHPTMFARFLREARILRRVAHPHVVRGFDARVEDGTVTIVMEPIDGPALSDWSEAATPTSRHLILGQLASGLAALHDAGIVHGDIKPTNVIVSDDRGAVIVDLGGATDLAVDPADRVARGTAGYVAPECLRGDSATKRSDVYSFAITAIETLLAQPLVGPPAKALDKLELSEPISIALHSALSLNPSMRPKAASMFAAFSPTVSEDSTRLRIERDGSRFRLGAKPSVDLRRRHAARRVLWALTEEALTNDSKPLSTRELLEIGWPGERVEAASGAHRVHVTIAKLRKLGLGERLTRGENGYRLTGLIDIRDPSASPND